MGTIALSLPQTGLPNSTEDVKVTNDLTILQNVINGNLDAANLSTTSGIMKLAATVAASNYAANYGDLVNANGVGITVTLPAPRNNAIVCVWNSGGSGASPTVVSGTNIYGVGLSAATSFKLGTLGAFAVLQSDGTSWLITSGQQDTGWLTMSLNSGWNAVAGNYVPAVRLVGDQVRLRGSVAVTSSANPITTLASQFRPAAIVWINTTADATNRLVQISTAGVMTGTGAALLDGLGYSLA